MNNTTDTKQKYCIEIADIQLTIISDESEEFVQDTVKTLDARIRDLTVRNKRCAKIDAAILCALDSLGEKLKLEKKVKNLEAQIDLYEANLRRLRGESQAPAAAEKPAEAAPAPKPADPVKPAEAPAPAAQKPAEEPKPQEPKADPKPKEEPKPKKMPQKPAAEQLTMDAIPAIPVKEEAEPAPAAEETAPEAPAEDKPAGVRDDKLKQIESLLRRRSESPENTEAAPDGRDDKLRQIEELLRVGGGRSLTEALQGAMDD